MNVGFIGTGSMGTILIDAFIRSGALQAGAIRASNRTLAKAEQIAERHPGLRATNSNAEAASGSDIVFICVKPSEYHNVLAELKNVFVPRQILVSITSPVLIRQLERLVPCKVVKVIPSITNYERSGAMLCMYGSRLSEAEMEKLETLLSHIGTPMRINETHTRITSDISSCGPAFFAFLLRQFVRAAVRKTGIPEQEAEALACEMLNGTGKLLTSGGFTPESLQNRVCVPGGITAEGIRILDRMTEGVFDRLIETTHAKFEEDLTKTEATLSALDAESNVAPAKNGFI